MGEPMKLTTITQITLDGVTQGNGGSTIEDRAGGFERGGWARGAGDDTTRDHIAATFQRAARSRLDEQNVSD